MKIFLATILMSLALAESAFGAVTGIESMTITVDNLKRTEAFYSKALGFQTVGRRVVQDEASLHLLGISKGKVSILTMKLGQEKVQFEEFSQKGKLYPKDSKSPDHWFQHFAIVVSDMERAYGQLHPYESRPISLNGPQTLPASTGGVKAYKFRDPDGHPLELLWFPKGQGRALWHKDHSDHLFLGIDHTAIGVGSTPKSKLFYESLGFEPAYEVLNTGPTQENLDGTWNAVVQITGMRLPGDKGLGVEFLDYRSPPTGRQTPVTQMANDIAHVHINVKVDNLSALEKTLFDARVPEISPRIVEPKLTDNHKSLMIEDPDGHGILLIDSQT